MTKENINAAIEVSGDREQLLSAIDEFIEKKGLRGQGPYLRTELHCGCRKDYRTRSDVPDSFDLCEHGNYFIEYISL